MTYVRLTVSRCVRWCFARSDEFEKAFGQAGNWQMYGFSPVWDRMCILRFSSLENALLHPGCCRQIQKKIGLENFESTIFRKSTRY